MLYVAYGSNLNKRQMKYRCPGAKIVGTGIITDYKLNFRGSKSGAYLTIDRSLGSITPVAVWDINENDKANLDRYEGYPEFYDIKEVKVNMDNGKVLKAIVYVMTPGREIGMPSIKYVDICVEGCKDFGLTTDYLIGAYFGAKEYLEVKQNLVIKK